MLVFNPLRMFRMRGIARPERELIKTGISPGAATKYLHYHNIRLTIGHIEKICVLLNCTPNELFEWRSKSNENLSENHSLNSLKRDQEPENLSEILKNVPVEKLSELNEFVRGLQENK